MMKRRSLHVIALAVLILAMGCTNDKKDAEQLFQEAQGLVQSGEEAAHRSFSEGLRLYEDAAGKAVTIIRRYPDLELAKGLQKGEKRLGSHTLEELRTVVIPALKDKAASERDFLTCALLLAKTIKDPQKRLLAFNRIASAKSAKLTDYEGIRKAIGTMEGSPLLAKTRVKIAEGLASFGKYEMALMTAREIGNASLRRSTLEAVATRMASAGACEKAVDIAREIKDPYFRDDALKGVALGCAKAGQWDRAAKMTDEFQDPKKKAETLTGIAEALAKGGRGEDASALLARAIAAAGTIDLPFAKSYVLGIVILRSPAMQPHHYDAVLEIVQGMGENTHKAFQLAGLAGRYAEAGKGDRARDLLSQALNMMDGIEYGPPPAIPRLDLAGYIARKYIDMGDYEKAMEIAESLKPTKQEQGLFGATRPLMLMATEFVKKGRYNEAYRILDWGEKGHEKVGPILRMHDEAMKSGQREQAGTLLSKALEATAAIGAMKQRADGYRDISRKFFDMGEKGKASIFLSKAIETTKHIMIDTKKMRSLQEILESPFLETRHCDEAVDLAEGMVGSPFQKKAFLMIAVKYAGLGQVENATGIVGGIENPGLRTKAMLDIGENQLKSGQRERGLATLAQAMTTAQGTAPKDGRSQVDMLLTFAGVYTRGKEKEKAAAILAQAEELAAGLEKAEERDSLFFIIAAMYMEMGKGKAALEAGKKIAHPEKEVDTLVMVSEGYEKSQREIGEDEKGVLHDIIKRALGS